MHFNSREKEASCFFKQRRKKEHLNFSIFRRSSLKRDVSLKAAPRGRFRRAAALLALETRAIIRTIASPVTFATFESACYAQQWYSKRSVARGSLIHCEAGATVTHAVSDYNETVIPGDNRSLGTTERGLTRPSASPKRMYNVTTPMHTGTLLGCRLLRADPFHCLENRREGNKTTLLRPWRSWWQVSSTLNV